MKPTRVSLLLCAFVFALPSRGLAQWQLDGTAISTAANDQVNPTLVSDGAGGAIVTWSDYRGDGDIYVQRLNASGFPQWTANGVALCTAAGEQSFQQIVSDGAGGAIVTWRDVRSGITTDIYAQRVNASGVPQWTANGVPLCTAGGDQYGPVIASDGAGGAIVTWEDGRGSSYDIYAQRVNASGVPQWTTNGVPVVIFPDFQISFTIASDGAGGAIVAWVNQNFSGTLFDIYAQRLNALGVQQWAVNGVAVCTAADYQETPTIVADGAGGAIVAWIDGRNGYDIYAQRMNASGVAQWTANGVALTNVTNTQDLPAIVSDGAGGAIVTWRDVRNGFHHDIYAQRVDASGAPQWTTNGVALCTAPNDQNFPTIVSDGAGGAVVTWSDGRSGGYDVYAQRVNVSGAPQWTTNGVALCTAVGDQYSPAIATDGAGGAIVTWYDHRGGSNFDIYAQKLGPAFGGWGQPWITSVKDVVGDQGGKVAVNWLASDLDRRPDLTITHYSVWRAVDPAAFSARAGTSTGPRLVDASAIGPNFQGDAIRHERVATTDYYWEWVGNQTFRYSASYSLTAATRADSIAGNPAVHYFQVLAHTSDPFVFWESNVMNGHSVDNLAPAAPLALTAQRVGSDVHLRWNRSIAADVRDYSVYRASATGVTPVPINFLSASDDTVLVDHNTPVSTLYYIVIASDVHENRSAPSNETSVQKLTGIGDAPSIATLTVTQNYPNPFSGSTDLSIGLPRDSDVSIQIYDVAGRLVRSESRSHLSAGWRRVTLEARGGDGKPLASGVYFCRIAAAGETITKKMVIAR